ncbi:SDR family NAD(P)-dependent oxidoreductase [Cupriavidus sp. D39]|uniref:SDR family NAD(P)-dependent oxidoreductase n=1 Tax=Cupriavidus sp. D39 TaxID=2997877 RepID=UPI0022706147|nr:SDR family oxidoreductase [Cupriavidus sp. D39]MCY0854669.1 SDR family oxidoreductase [Cupriavidus sp. D39]
MQNLLQLDQRVALITGAGQGVGRQTALHFANHGCKTVIINDFVAEKAEAVAAEVEALGARAIVLAGDVCDYDAMTAAVDRARQAAGGLHILVNNAGNAGPGGTPESFPPFWETGPDDWNRWLGTNLQGVLVMCRAALPHIISGGGGGSIINIISDAGRVGEPHLAVYSAAKAGAAGFSRALAKAVGGHNIRVNSVALASINTPGVQSMLADTAAVQRMLRQYIVRRLGEPEDAANMILFLASAASSWISGQTYAVNGGYSVS